MQSDGKFYLKFEGEVGILVTENQLTQDLFSPTNAMQCQICGELIPVESLAMTKHLEKHEAPELCEQIPCPECNGEKRLDYVDPHDPASTINKACEVCNPHGDEPDEDADYESFKDAQIEAELEQRDGY